MQRDNRTTFNQPNSSTPAQASRAVSRKSGAVSPQVNRTALSPAGRAGGQSNPTSNVTAVTCRKCKSQQVVANKRGYSFANMFKTLGIMIFIGVLTMVLSNFVLLYSVGDVPRGVMELVIAIGAISFFLALPVSILVGFARRSELVNGCMNCGFKWRPAKR